MEKLNFKELTRSVVVIREWDAAGRLLRTQRTTNTLTYAAAGLLLTALLRSGPSQVTHLYARFGTDAQAGFLVPDNADVQRTQRTDFLEAPNSAVGGLWVPVLAAPVQETTDNTKYAGNRATFLFRIPYNLPAAQISPADNFSLSTSKIFALGLAVAQNLNVREQDVIFSVLQAFTNDADPTSGYFQKFLIAPGGQTTVDYTVEFFT